MYRKALTLINVQGTYRLPLLLVDKCPAFMEPGHSTNKTSHVFPARSARPANLIVCDLTVLIILDREPGSSVSIMSGFGLDDQAIEIRSPAEAKGFFL
jgi:hypothetical protein